MSQAAVLVFPMSGGVLSSGSLSSSGDILLSGGVSSAGDTSLFGAITPSGAVLLSSAVSLSGACICLQGVDDYEARHILHSSHQQWTRDNMDAQGYCYRVGAAGPG